MRRYNMHLPHWGLFVHWETVEETGDVRSCYILCRVYGGKGTSWRFPVARLNWIVRPITGIAYGTYRKKSSSKLQCRVATSSCIHTYVMMCVYCIV